MRVLGITPEYAVCSNGAVIMRRAGESYERFHTETFDPHAVLELLRAHLPDARYLVELPDGQRLYTDYMDDWNLHRAAQVEFHELSHQPVSRVVVVAPDRSEYDFLELVERIGLNQSPTPSGGRRGSTSRRRASTRARRSSGVRDWLEIDPSRVLVMGDGRNDLGMFAWALRSGGRAVAMGQGRRRCATPRER